MLGCYNLGDEKRKSFGKVLMLLFLLLLCFVQFIKRISHKEKWHCYLFWQGTWKDPGPGLWNYHIYPHIFIITFFVFCMSGIKCGPQSASPVCSWLYCLLTAFIDIFHRKWVKREKTTNNIIISCVGGSEDKAAGIYGVDIVDCTKQIGGISVPMYTNWRKKLKTLISRTWPHFVMPTVTH